MLKDENLDDIGIVQCDLSCDRVYPLDHRPNRVVEESITLGREGCVNPPFPDTMSPAAARRKRESGQEGNRCWLQGGNPQYGDTTVIMDVYPIGNSEAERLVKGEKML